MIEQKLIRASSEDDPERCQGVGQNGQCPFRRADENTQYCLRHGGNKGTQLLEKKKVSEYKIAIWQRRLEEFTESDDAKSLRSEIGLLKILMEEIWKKCDSPTALLIHSGRIGELATRIQNLVFTCDRLEQKSGQLMDKAAALAFAARVVDIIGMHVQDIEVIDRISDDIITALRDCTGNKIQFTETQLD